MGLVNEGQVLERVLPAGPLRRGELWEACHTTANPAVATLSGAQLRHMLAVDADDEFRRGTTGPLRGRPRGRLFVAGLDGEPEDRDYVVAATDFELEDYGGYVERGWRLAIRYEFPTIVREAIEEELQRAQ
ncbi:MAG TPA: hypothetical protein VFL66_13550 [Gaiellaceae bacterium]|nr:hypothetical protein [Gaiellaceae bacterium]